MNLTKKLIKSAQTRSQFIQTKPECPDIVAVTQALGPKVDCFIRLLKEADESSVRFRVPAIIGHGC